MKPIFLFMLFVMSFQNMGYAQADRFFDDVTAMKLSLCFKGYIVADSNMDPGRLISGITSQKVFLTSDSSMMVLVRLGNIPSRVTKSATPYVPPSKNGSQNSPSKKAKLLIEKFGARSGSADFMEGPSKRFHGYVDLWGAMLFSKRGMISIVVSQKENSRKKMSEKALLNLAREFINFND